jgi:glc operon protein GlcG
MSSNTLEIAIGAHPTSNGRDEIPDQIPFDVPYGSPISLDRAEAVISAAIAEAKKRNWKMNVAVVDSGGNLVAFQRMDGAMLASIQIAAHKARAAQRSDALQRSSRTASSLCIWTTCSPSME